MNVANHLLWFAKAVEQDSLLQTFAMYDKSDRDHFSFMWEIARLCTNMQDIAVSRVPLLPRYIYIPYSA